MFETTIEPPVRPAASRQLVLLARDASNSMLETVDNELGINKAAAVAMATGGLLRRLVASSKSANFHVSLLDYHDQVSHRTAPVPLSAFDLDGDLDPTCHGVGGTFIGSALEAGAEVAHSFLADTSSGLPSSVVFVILSDGECLHPDRTRALIDGLRRDERITVAAAFFATRGRPSNGPALLQALTSDPVRLYREVYDAETLRDFFEKSVAISAARVGIAE